MRATWLPPALGKKETLFLVKNDRPMTQGASARHILIIGNRSASHPLRMWDLVWLVENLVGFNVQGWVLPRGTMQAHAWRRRTRCVGAETLGFCKAMKNLSLRRALSRCDTLFFRRDFPGGLSLAGRFLEVDSVLSWRIGWKGVSKGVHFWARGVSAPTGLASFRPCLPPLGTNTSLL